MPYIHNINTKLGYFCGWQKFGGEEEKFPILLHIPESAITYDLSIQKQEALEDYEALVVRGHEPSLDTVWVGER